MIGLITFGAKWTGERSAGKPHAAFEVAGAGNGVTVGSLRARKGKPGTQTRPRPNGPPRQPSILPGVCVDVIISWTSPTSKAFARWLSFYRGRCCSYRSCRLWGTSSCMLFNQGLSASLKLVLDRKGCIRLWTQSLLTYVSAPLSSI